MAITVTSVDANQTIPPSLAQGGLHVYSGIVECVFRGDHPDADGVTRDTLTFLVGPVSFPGSSGTPVASCTVSLASFAYDGVVTNPLWAVDRTEVANFVNVDSGSGTAQLQVVAHLALRGPSGLVLRVNYILFYPQ